MARRLAERVPAALLGGRREPDGEARAARPERCEHDHCGAGDDEERLGGDREGDRLRGRDAARDQDRGARTGLGGRAGRSDRKRAGGGGGDEERERDRERDADPEGAEEQEKGEAADEPRGEDERGGGPGVPRRGHEDGRTEAGEGDDGQSPAGRGSVGGGGGGGRERRQGNGVDKPEHEEG